MEHILPDRAAAGSRVFHVWEEVDHGERLPTLIFGKRHEMELGELGRLVADWLLEGIRDS
jgi:hypothetical protein